MKQATLSTYTTGFVLSIVLTLVAFALVYEGMLFGGALVAAVMALAVVQLWVQMTYFLFAGSGPSLRWNQATFFSTLVLILIIVLGSVWIMNHLNYRMMSSPSEMQMYIQGQQGF